MSVTLDATVGGAHANAYVDVTAAQALIDATPNSGAWGSDDDAQAVALVYATTMLDAMSYRGTRSTVTQSLQWPRIGVIDPNYGDDTEGMGYMQGTSWGIYLDSTTIPVRIQRACTMLALEILRAGVADVWGVDRDANIARKGVDVLTKEFVPVSQRRFGLRTYPSVWREIFPLTAVSGSVERA